MAVVDQSSVDVALSLFSSLNTELSAETVPEGISPDNSDVAYLPGSVFTRPGLERVFVAALIASGQITFQKTYVQPTGIPQNLYLTSDGKLWLEQVAITPGTATLLFQSTATMASSVTAFGREYIALSDGKHGADIPVQWDGINLWRVTQDGPGSPPTVTSIALPSTVLQPTAVVFFPIATTTATSPTTVGGLTYYTQLQVVLVTATTAFSVGQQVTLSGVSLAFNVTTTIASVGTDGKTFTVAYFRTTGGTVAGGNFSTAASTLVRSNNTVTGATTTPHGLKRGYQVQISKIPASVIGGSIASIVLNNADLAGVATVTMTAPHGLLPNNFVNIAGVNPTAVGGGISNIGLSGDVVTVTTNSAHGLQIGSVVNVAPVTNSKLAGQWYVTTVPTPTTFTFAFIDTDIAAGADTGSVTYVWPLANANPELNYFTVLTSPTALTFTIALSYTDGTWMGGTVTFAWDGNFYVTNVPSPTSFQYQQYGPNSQTTALGTVTPYGQATPGIHQVQQAFLLMSGAITAPSPPATFVANGGQYLNVSDLAIGPANVAGRILLFTGAGGAYFFYIPEPAQVNGLQVSTATQINDNTTTSVLLDFADATLYAAVGCSIPGNNLAAQVVLGPNAGFFTYSSRLQAWGEHNKVQNFLNMGFDGGYLPSEPATPTGWTGTGAFVPGRPSGFAFQITCPGTSDTSSAIYQNAAFDTGATAILLPNTAYRLRIWLEADFVGVHGAIFIATVFSTSTGFSSIVLIPNASLSTTGQWHEVPFSVPMPTTIPADLTLRLEAFSAGAVHTLTLDEVELIYDQQPYLDHQERLSYSANPEGFDGLTGVLGPEDDLTPIMNHGVLRNTLYLVTGRAVHETNDNGSTEPSGWNVDEIDDECGAYSIASIARNPQGIGSAGKGFMAWSGPDGAHVFTGRNPSKCSQEIQSLWDALDITNAQLAWAKNDQVNKRIYFGIPLSGSQMQVLVLDYRNLDTGQIGELPPVRISFTGKMIASDLTRKWTQWTANAFSGEMMSHGGALEMTFGGQTSAGGAQSWTLNDLKYSDDDTATQIIPAYYTTYFFVSGEQEQALQLGSHRKEYDYLTVFSSGIGTISATPLLCSLTNPQAPTPNIVLSMDPKFDLEIGINVVTSRCAFRMSATPLLGQTDSYFSLQKMVVNVKKSPWSPVRGTNTGGS